MKNTTLERRLKKQNQYLICSSIILIFMLLASLWITYDLIHFVESRLPSHNSVMIFEYYDADEYCGEMTTDMEITNCTGDIDPADPKE